MLKYSYIIILLLFVFNSCNDNKNSINFTSIKKVNINLIDSIMVRNDSIAITDAKLIHVLDDTIYWFNDFSPELFIFDKNFKLIKQIDFSGKGPGEYNTGYKINISNNNNMRIYDLQTNRMILFDGLLKFSNSFFYTKDKINTFCAVGDTKLIVQIRDAKTSLEPAFVLLDTTGSEIMRGGTKPVNAILQDVLFGGSVIVDKDENIYYSYMADYRIWKVDTKTKLTSVFNNKPDYFIESKPNEVKELTQNEFAKYYFAHSRTWNIFFVEPDLIVQQIFPKKLTRDRKKLISYLEIYNTEGIKLGTKILFNKTIINAQNNKLYCKPFIEENSNQFNKVEIYEIKL